MGMRISDLSGKKFGRLTAIKISSKPSPGIIIWECVCDCGKVHFARAGNLRTGTTKSCGCFKEEVCSKVRHGHAARGNISSTYQSWAKMIVRCTNPNSIRYENWGGRGITVCDEWKKSFEQFLKDMGTKPGPHYSIDRIDNDKGYYPENCRWASKVEQARNTRPKITNVSGVKGVSPNRRTGAWVANIRVNGKQTHLGTFYNLEDAIEARKMAEARYWNNTIQGI